MCAVLSWLKPSAVSWRRLGQAGQDAGRGKNWLTKLFHPSETGLSELGLLQDYSGVPQLAEDVAAGARGRPGRGRRALSGVGSAGAHVVQVEHALRWSQAPSCTTHPHVFLIAHYSCMWHAPKPSMHLPWAQQRQEAFFSGAQNCKLISNLACVGPGTFYLERVLERLTGTDRRVGWLRTGRGGAEQGGGVVGDEEVIGAGVAAVLAGGVDKLAQGGRRPLRCARRRHRGQPRRCAARPRRRAAERAAELADQALWTPDSKCLTRRAELD